LLYSSITFLICSLTFLIFSFSFQFLMACIYAPKVFSQFFTNGKFELSDVWFWTKCISDVLQIRDSSSSSLSLKSSSSSSFFSFIMNFSNFFEYSVIIDGFQPA
jgi:hypothetical protein